jgi:hypothetical protein
VIDKSLFPPLAQAPALTVESESIAELAAEVKSIVADMREADKLDLQRTVRLGTILAKIKAKTGHGKWLPRLEEFGIDRRRAAEAILLSKCPPADISSCKSKKEALLRNPVPEFEEEEIPDPASGASNSASPNRKFCSRPCRVGQGPNDCKKCRKLNTEAQTTEGSGNQSEEGEPSEDEESGDEVDAKENDVPPRLRPIFEKQQEFKKLSAHLRSGIPLAKPLEQSEGYELAHKGRPRKEYSTFFQNVAEELDGIAPGSLCPDCKGAEASQDNDDGENSCKKCSGKGYLTVEEVEEAK